MSGHMARIRRSSSPRYSRPTKRAWISSGSGAGQASPSGKQRHELLRDAREPRSACLGSGHEGRRPPVSTSRASSLNARLIASTRSRLGFRVSPHTTERLRRALTTFVNPRWLRLP